MNSRTLFTVATTFKSQIDDSILCIISDVFVLVEIYTTAKLREDYNANKIQPDAKYSKQRIRSKINHIVPLDRDSRMQTLQSPGVVLPSIQDVLVCLAHNVRVSVSRWHTPTQHLTKYPQPHTRTCETDNEYHRRAPFFRSTASTI